MALHAQIKAFMQFLAANPQLRRQISAPTNATILYAGDTVQNNPWKRDTPVYRKIQSMRLTNPSLAQKQMLNDVLERLPAPGTSHPSLLAYANHVDELLKKDGVAKKDQILIWRALSGIYASNARGAVSFIIGKGVSSEELKVFALTEMHVIGRNPNVDAITHDMVEYLKKCVLTHADPVASLIRTV